MTDEKTLFNEFNEFVEDYPALSKQLGKRLLAIQLKVLKELEDDEEHQIIKNDYPVFAKAIRETDEFDPDEGELFKSGIEYVAWPAVESDIEAIGVELSYETNMLLRYGQVFRRVAPIPPKGTEEAVPIEPGISEATPQEGTTTAMIVKEEPTFEANTEEIKEESPEESQEESPEELPEGTMESVKKSFPKVLDNFYHAGHSIKGILYEDREGKLQTAYASSRDAFKVHLVKLYEDNPRFAPFWFNDMTLEEVQYAADVIWRNKDWNYILFKDSGRDDQ